MTWLVTGGAGYIGAHVVRALVADGQQVVVLDDLSTGDRSRVDPGAVLVEGTVLDRGLVRAVLRDHAVSGVVHIAAKKQVGESVADPLLYYRENVEGLVALLDGCREQGVDRFVFSSSAATYGLPDVDLVTEQTPGVPLSPYGESKLIGEWLLRDQAVATGLRHTSLRYFNVVGSGSDDLYDTSPHNLFPVVFEALLAGRTPRINGDDYDTPDGTCVRDYVHVTDLALAHVVAARRLAAGDELAPVYNLGSGSGVSVRQIMDSVRDVTGSAFTPEIGPRRPGDPARIVASGDLAARDLEWQMRHDLHDMVASAWSARRRSAV
jgi:UDP-glucose 4-epimerase